MLSATGPQTLCLPEDVHEVQGGILAGLYRQVTEKVGEQTVLERRKRFLTERLDAHSAVIARTTADDDPLPCAGAKAGVEICERELANLRDPSWRAADSHARVENRLQGEWSRYLALRSAVLNRRSVLRRDAAPHGEDYLTRAEIEAELTGLIGALEAYQPEVRA